MQDWNLAGQIPVLHFPVLHFQRPRCKVSPLWGEILQSHPMSNLNTGVFALGAMLPVMTVSHRKEDIFNFTKIVGFSKLFHFGPLRYAYC